MKEKGNLWEKELWTQNEVADYFRVTANTIKNWRNRGLLSFFIAPGSDRVLYYRREIENFQETFTQWRKEPQKGQERVVRVKPRLSSDDDWRIS
ncbi:MAG: helix-turn-helix domain-containing protein [Deltaproteobacteria bacterium]|jgi:hypothetical protein|nr:helix-turn-helix domain-containing protein [Deltaproteobacteria bacterium]